uniref:Secreted protein n=1 Tax=Steinernema glaseri TaxID=37863 RepID=A0A1I7ZUR7_9BILA
MSWPVQSPTSPFSLFVISRTVRRSEFSAKCALLTRIAAKATANLYLDPSFIKFMSGLMKLLFVSASFLILLQNTSASPPDPDKAPKGCSARQLIETPCRCCKMDCWYTVASSATHELGHVPGQEGEDEAMATLKLIRACMISECANIC